MTDQSDNSFGKTVRWLTRAVKFKLKDGSVIVIENAIKVDTDIDYSLYHIEYENGKQMIVDRKDIYFIKIGSEVELIFN